MATNQDYRAILMPTEPFAPLQIACYIDRAHKIKLFKGECIQNVTRGIDDLYYFYVDQGEIETSFENEEGARTFIRSCNEGNAFSSQYEGFASIGRYKASFVAKRNSVVYAFSQKQLYDIAREDDAIFYEFIYVCHISFAQSGHRIANISAQPAEKRLAMWLQKLCLTQAPNPNGTYTIPCKLSLQQLADLLNMHVTTCTKLLSGLEEKGVVRRTRQCIQVIDVKRLAGTD